MPDEHSVAIVSFEGAIKRKMAEVRSKLQQLQDTGQTKAFRLDIEVSGRTDGDLSIAYKLGASYSSTEMVEGNSIDPVVEEYLRRKGWDTTHKIKAISGPAVDKIPS